MSSFFFYYYFRCYYDVWKSKKKYLKIMKNNLFLSVIWVAYIHTIDKIFILVWTRQTLIFLIFLIYVQSQCE